MKNQLFIALIPLVLFWAVEEYFGLRAALLVGLIAAVGEVGFERIRYKKVSFITWVSNGLILGLGLLSLWMDSGAAFKLQPAVMELGMVVFMLISQKKTGEAFMVQMFREFKGVELERKQQALSQPWFLERMRATNTRICWFFALHGLLLAGVALYGTTKQWILLKGVLFYVLLVGVMAPMYKRPKPLGTKPE